MIATPPVYVIYGCDIFVATLNLLKYMTFIFMVNRTYGTPTLVFPDML